MKFIIDIESSGLLGDGLDYSSLPYKLKDTYRIWCVVIRNITTGAVLSLREEECTGAAIKQALEGCTELIGHNIVGFDLPVLKLYTGFDYVLGYPGLPSYLFGNECIFTDTLLWSKLLHADRYGGHSLAAWGKRLGNNKGDWHDWSKFSEEMLEYCIQDTSVNAEVHEALIKEQGTHYWTPPYRMEVKLADLTLKQELFGFAFNRDKAKQNIEELTAYMHVIQAKVNPLLPVKLMTKSELSTYTLPKIRFKKNGELSSHMQKFLDKHQAVINVNMTAFTWNSADYVIADTEFLINSKPASVEDIDVVKKYLLDMGWVAIEVKERDLCKKPDKSEKTRDEIESAIQRYVNQTETSLFRELRLEFLGCDFDDLQDLLQGRIQGTKPIYVPTNPRLTIGLEKEICPNLVALGEKADFVKDVVHYFTYRHRKNSIAGGVVLDGDEEDEPLTGFLSAVREDGRIPTPADTLGANTGRYRHKVVCNVPRITSLYGEPMRALFGCGKGLFQLGYDFASLEARIMGHYVIPYKDGKELAESLVAAKPQDLHTLTSLKLGIKRDSAKSMSYACLPMQTRVLTKEGWQYFDQLQEGQVILTYNAEKNIIEEDVILKKHLKPQQEVYKYGNSFTNFECTEDHRWYGKRRTHTRGKPRKWVFDFTEASKLTTEHNILLAAPWVGGDSSVTKDEAALLGWVLSDGYYSWSKRSEKTSASNGKRKQLTMSLSQAQSKFWKEIEELLERMQIPYGRYDKEQNNGNTVYCYSLSSKWTRPFMDRLFSVRQDKHKVDWCKWVLSLSREALESFYDAFYKGDGHTKGTAEVITQNHGNIFDALVIVMQLLGKGQIRFSEKTEKCRTIRITKTPFLTGMRLKKQRKGIEDTFCLTTKNSTFIIWQDDFVGITGNCIYGAQPKKLAKMLGVSEQEAKRLFNAYWEAVPALKELKDKLESVWEKSGKKHILGLDGRILSTRSKHSLINVLFQSGGAIAAKWSAVYLAQELEEQGILGNPFEDSLQEHKVWWLIHMHDEQQLGVHPALMQVKNYSSDEEAQAAKVEGCSSIGHGSKGAYMGFKTAPIECIETGIARANARLELRVTLGYEWSTGLTWSACH